MNGAAVPAGKWSPVLLNAQTQPWAVFPGPRDFSSSLTGPQGPKGGVTLPWVFQVAPFLKDAKRKTKALDTRT